MQSEQYQIQQYTYMKKFSVIALSLICVASLTVNAAEKKKHEPLTQEQKALKKEMNEKYDANKDGKLDKDEMAKISKEDKEKMDKAGLGHHKKADAAASAKTESK
jgi:hypothetical protein